MTIVRYSIQLSDHRTSVSIDKILSDLIAIKLGVSPGTPLAHQAVRKYLDHFIAHDRKRGGFRLSQYITEEAILGLVDKELYAEYMKYIMEVDGI